MRQIPKEISDDFHSFSAWRQLWYLIRYDFDYTLYKYSQDEGFLQMTFTDVKKEMMNNNEEKFNELVWYKKMLSFLVLYSISTLAVCFITLIKTKSKRFEKTFPEYLL